mgnify:CR=1 FL=1
MKTGRLSDHWRYSARIPLDIYINKIINHTPYMVKVKNISSSGVYIHRLLEPATDKNKTKRVTLEMMLPGSDDLIWARGRVVRESIEHERGVVGEAIYFEKIRDKDRKLIENYVESTINS